MYDLGIEKQTESYQPADGVKACPNCRYIDPELFCTYFEKTTKADMRCGFFLESPDSKIKSMIKKLDDVLCQ
jgi:hypothetical protein